MPPLPPAGPARRARRAPPPLALPVVVVAASMNAKIGRAAATYRTQATCPADCQFRDNGCYAESGPVSWSVTRRLNAVPAPDLAALFAREAEYIRALPGDRPLRLSGVGDVPTAAAARTLAAACRAYAARGGYPAWAYTRHWRAVPRRAWGGVSVLASVDAPAEAAAARRRGYAAAVVVPAFTSARAHPLPGAPGFKLLPCPNQTRGVTCSDCRLCFDAARLRDARLVIGFAPPGSLKEAVRRTVSRRVALPTVN